MNEKLQTTLNEALDNDLNDTKEELQWMTKYAESIEAAILEMRSLINESTGVTGYHLNGDVAPWNELMGDSMFEIAEMAIENRKRLTIPSARVTSEARKVMYIKEYPNMPCTLQFTPIYGGMKYVRDDM